MRNLLKALLLSSLCAQVMGFQEINKNDLYEHFFNIDNNRECKKNTSCKMLRRHLKRDSKKCVMNPVEVGVVENYVLQRSQATHKNVRGTMRYLGAVPGSYGYDTYLDETGTLVIESRIHFSNLADFSESAINFMKDKLLRAANVWTDSNRYTDYPVRFSLLLETNKRNSHISAKLQDPYTQDLIFQSGQQAGASLLWPMNSAIFWGLMMSTLTIPLVDLLPVVTREVSCALPMGFHRTISTT
jgi:hypothetical protein